MYLIGDCHGNAEGLNRALMQARLIDNHGHRTTTEAIYSIGDLINAVKDSVEGDKACLQMVKDGFIDGIIIGNHEIPYFDKSNTFSGFHHDVVINDTLHELMDTDKIHPAVLVDKTLVSHAGLSAHLSLYLPVEDVFERLDHAWEERNWNHSWFSSIGHTRGGLSPVGGLLWCDFDDEFVPTEFPQIVGHTPSGLCMKGNNALCIDVGAKDQNTQPLILRLV